MHVAKTFIEEKKKCTNKGNTKHEDADFSYTIQQVNVPNFKILGRVVPEKSLVEKSLHTYTHKHCYRKDKNYTLPIYFVCWGINMDRNS